MRALLRALAAVGTIFGGLIPVEPPPEVCPFCRWDDPARHPAGSVAPGG